MITRFRKQHIEEWSELIHDGPRIEVIPQVSMFVFYKKKKFHLPPDISKYIKDFFRLKNTQQQEFKEKFTEGLRVQLNKIYPSQTFQHLHLDECSFVELPTASDEETNPSATTLYNPTIILDGKYYKYSSAIDPSGFFFGRGDANPYSGCYRRRISPKNITINCSSWLNPDREIHKQWGGVVCEPYASWLASWKDPVTNKLKYIFIPRNTEQNQRVDKLKYDAAFELSGKIEEIRIDYWKILKRTDDLLLLQIATVLYLIDHFSIRIGNPTEQRTFGACTLRKEHIKLLKNSYIQLDFPGKDSVRYCRTHDIDPSVYRGLKILFEMKHERLFPSCSPGDINKYLQQFGNFSVKSFRTMNACLLCNSILQRPLQEITNKEKLANYNKACSYVAEICNHQRKSPHGVLTYSVATGKGNYIDPRIVVSFCKRNDMDIRLCYSKTLLEKNSWALEERSPWDMYY